MTESRSSFCSQREYISHACRMMCTVTPGKNGNIPQASFIQSSQRTFYPAWWLKQSSKCLFGFFSPGPKCLQENECESHSLRECIDHRATVKRNNSKKWDCLLVFHKYKLTIRISQHPVIGKMPFLFFFFSVSTYWTILEVKLNFCSAHQDLIHVPTYPIKNVYIYPLVGKGKT